MHNIFYLGLSGEHCCPLGFLFCVSETLKLDNGNAPDAGYFSSLSVYRFGTWGQICGEFWDHQDATVACQQLGYKGGKASFYDRGQNVPLLVGRIECQGNETRLEDCEETEQFCDTGRVAGVFCYKSQGNLSFMTKKTDFGVADSLYSYRSLGVSNFRFTVKFLNFRMQETLLLFI